MTVHEAPITLRNWTGSGYFVIDPFTGAGGYLISGGSNGSALTDFLSAVSGFFLGMVSGGLGVNIAKTILFSETLKYQQRMLRAAKFTGYLGLFASLYLIFFFEDLSWNSVGLASVSLSSFALTAKLIALLVPFALTLFTGVVGAAILAGAIAIVVGLLASKLAKELFP